MTWLLPNRFGSLRLDFCALGLGSYLIELVVDESVDQGWLADPAVSDEDDVAVVSGLGQTVPDTPHHGRTKHRRIKTEPCLSKRSHKNGPFFSQRFYTALGFFIKHTSLRHKNENNTEAKEGTERERSEKEKNSLRVGAALYKNDSALHSSPVVGTRRRHIEMSPEGWRCPCKKIWKPLMAQGESLSILIQSLSDPIVHIIMVAF